MVVQYIYICYKLGLCSLANLRYAKSVLPNRYAVPFRTELRHPQFGGRGHGRSVAGVPRLVKWSSPVKFYLFGVGECIILLELSAYLDVPGS